MIGTHKFLILHMQVCCVQMPAFTITSAILKTSLGIWFFVMMHIDKQVQYLSFYQFNNKIVQY